MLGMISFLGYSLLKKDIASIIKGTIKTIVGFLILKIGANILVDTTKPIIDQLSKAYKINGAIIDPYVSMISTIDMIGKNYSWVGYTVLLASLLNILMVFLHRITGIRTIMLSGEVMFQQTGLTVAFFHLTLQTDLWKTIIYSSILMALYWGIGSNIMYQPTQKVTKNSGFSIGHQQQFASWIAFKLAPYFGNKSEDINHIQLPGWLNLFNDHTVATGIIMTFFWGVILLTLDFNTLKEIAQKKHWSIYILETGMMFSVAITIIVEGVKMFVSELSIAFRGISQRLIPGAILAIDCSAIYGFSPNAVLWGFIWGALGQLFAIIVLFLFNSSTVIIPGFIPMFFSNGTVGVYANHFGGWRAALKICFIMGCIEIFGSLWAMKLAGMNSWMGMADWAILAPVTMQAFKISQLSIIALVVLVIIYMYFASYKLRLEKNTITDN
ncbi:Ascorbate-specific PTS system, EIIC component [Liberibacter crescens BT-1]|uniref:Ascorbate-specific PTS system EIIC component n=2 Tax=Liberibacter crescens TaxID=1273132 RepID=L0ESU7_LIBCB|nr:Ascorbate-specific PTS system, EIIC component [Liberibacter crescens BT-1]